MANNFERYCEKIVQMAAEKYLAIATRVIEEDLSWNGQTEDIVDKGNLRDSGKLEQKSWDRIDVVWDGNGITPAAIVHEGRRTKNGYIPGKPWTDVATQRFKRDGVQ